MIKNNDRPTLAAIGAGTIIALTALTINSGGRFDSSWSKDGGSITIEGGRPPLKTNDCLPSGESSHHLNCDNQ
jgi:hypothetical protein